ncbi:MULTISPECIES: DUF1629 domain-containing protein [unclassified Pseudomonas]|uniref:Imm43 family immunity protein n=1 Tax=unclassified Pseudomonas TaxID=196821 RepID=UPI00128B645F|nr:MULTISPECIES: DUF1629 domain-containing protein [unclassified Pseudomonas]MPQ65275.1 hypothetical protein [Pseudomonas sp. MWU12-2323]
MFYTLAFKKDKNCPTFIDGVIHESFSPGAYDDSMDADWHDAGPDETLAPLPEKLVLITKDKRYDFDFCTAFEGHIVSERFLKVFQNLKTSRWEVAELEIVNPKGISVAQRKYFFMRQQRADREAVDVIDQTQSKINFRANGEIKNIISLTLKENVSTDFFSIDEITLLGFIFLSPHAAAALKELNLVGAEVVDTGKVGSIDRA